LQSAAGPGQIIINETAYNKVKESFNCKPVGEVTLKNKSGMMMIYEVMD
jgi:adenylate cyclase